MKSILLSLLVFGSVNAMAEKFLGNAWGSIEQLRCYSTFEGKQTDYVTIVRSERNKDGYVDGLMLKGVWYDDKNKQHYADFDVIYVSKDGDNDDQLLIVGKSPENNALELNIPLSTDPDTVHESTMRINAVRKDFLKFNCEVLRAG